MSYDLAQFRNIIAEILGGTKFHSQTAVNLLLGTAAQESQFGTQLNQFGVFEGEAQGPFQMEPWVAEGQFDNYLVHRPETLDWIERVSGVGKYDFRALRFNLAYQICLCRIKYYRAPEKLPHPDDIPMLAHYWKKHYNTYLGKGRIEEFEANYHRFVLQGE